MNYFIITGTSRGIGEALAKQLLDHDNRHIICIARTVNSQLIRLSESSSSKLTYYPFDLSQLDKLDELFQDIFETINAAAAIESIALINNAAVLAPIGPIEENPTEDIINNVAINLIAPMAIVSNFIKYTNSYQIDKRIMNISSGSAKYLLPAQSCYSTTKAALDSFSKSIRLEQLDKAFPVKIASVYPGVINTQLQTELRSVDKEVFPYVDQFTALHEQGKLQSPEYTATKLCELLLHENFGQQVVVEDLLAGV